MSDKRLYAIRGATFCENTKDSITNCVGEMCRLIFTENRLSSDDIVSIQFTMTEDLDILNPATALRLNPNLGLDVSAVPLFCSQEVKTKGMLKKIVRVLITCYMPCDSTTHPAYINGAQILRPDLGESRK
ncbi:MAG: chorismate mutase [Treponema sp.]|nr:chorismate mutase [Treponema sp.]